MLPSRKSGAHVKNYKISMGRECSPTKIDWGGASKSRRKGKGWTCEEIVMPNIAIVSFMIIRDNAAIKNNVGI